MLKDICINPKNETKAQSNTAPNPNKTNNSEEEEIIFKSALELLEEKRNVPAISASHVGR